MVARNGMAEIARDLLKRPRTLPCPIRINSIKPLERFDVQNAFDGLHFTTSPLELACNVDFLIPQRFLQTSVLAPRDFASITGPEGRVPLIRGPEVIC